jgi:carboxyl-terminal processing protease
MSYYSRFLLMATAALLLGCRDSSKEAHSIFSDPAIAQTFEIVGKDYVEKPDEKKMIEGALNGMLMALDPYSCFFNQESYKIYTQSSKGEFGGLGMEVLVLDGMLKVVAPMDDMPAQKAGIKAGDVITQVDNIPIANLAPTDILKTLHGKPGTSITLKISRRTGAPFTVKIVRALIIVNPIKYRIEGNIGYVRISYFNDQTTDKLKDALNTIHKKLGKNLQGLVLDLRNNPGGDPEQAVAISSLFLDAGIIVQIKGRNPSHNHIYKAKGKDQLKGIPIAVLINQGSASASEIVAAALRDNHRAVLVGEKSFGKGSIQGLYKLENYGGIKLTIARFYTPKGEEIHGKGVQPDITLAYEATPESLQEAFKEAPKEPHKEAGTEDKQLQRAIDLLHGLWAVKGRP